MNTTETIRFQADMLAEQINCIADDAIACEAESALARIRQAHLILDRMHAIISDTLQP